MQAIVAAVVAALLKEAPGALLAILRGAGLLPDGDDSEHIARLHQSAAAIMATNPMGARKKRAPEVVELAPEYEYDKPETD